MASVLLASHMTSEIRTPHGSPAPEPYPKLLDTLRYVCAYLLYMYGTSKLAHVQFHLQAQLAPRPVGSLSGYELTWFYYGYSPIYADILGALQVLGATLLMFRRTTLMGAVMVLPMMANILLIDFFFLVGDHGPQFTATLIACSMLLILWHQRRALLALFWTAQPEVLPSQRRTHRWLRVLIWIAVLSSLLAGLFFQSRHITKP